LFQNKTAAVILAVLTFVIASLILLSIISYIFGYSLSSLPKHQLYVFFVILLAAVLASVVYGRGSKERASRVAQILNESLGVELEENDVWKLLRAIEQLPTGVINKYISLNINAASEFEDEIKEYKGQLSDDDLQKISKIIQMPVGELQDLLNQLYLETNLEQLKVLADPNAEPFLELNLQKLKEILFR